MQTFFEIFSKDLKFNKFLINKKRTVVEHTEMLFLFFLSLLKLAVASDATSGKLFSGKKIRIFTPTKRIQQNNFSNLVNIAKSYPNCKYWGIATTIFEPSKAFDVFLQTSKQFCLAIVADLKTPVHKYQTYDKDRVLVLDVQFQTQLASDISYVNRLPWNSFARKNVGYLFGLAAKAEAIFDFDDDNIINNLNTFRDVMQKQFDSFTNHIAFTDSFIVNYMPLFLQKNESSFHWPRGLPLTEIKSCPRFKEDNTGQHNTMIWQSLASNDPDVDAISRLATNYKIDFKNGLSLSLGKTFSPLNAQSCIWFKEAYIGLHLPFTVHGRVSDIWRSYISQKLIHSINGSIVVSSPFVVQERNAHNYLADFNSEIPLYEQSGALISVLNNTSMSQDKFKNIELLHKEAYEAGFIEISDVEAAIDWMEIVRHFESVY